MNYDQIIEKLGKFGLYQYIVFGVTCFYTFMPGVDYVLLIMMVYQPNFNCTLPNSTLTSSDNYIIARDQCTYTLKNSTQPPIACTEFTYDTEFFTQTFVTEFNLVCERAFHAKSIQTVHFVGFTAGSIIGYFGDLFGRQKIIYGSMISQVCIFLLEALLPGVFAQYLLHALYGLSTNLTSQGFILLTELTPARKRGLIGGNYWNCWCFGYMAAPIFGYLGGDWRIIRLYSIIPTIFYLISFYIIPESPRWLLLKDRKDDAVKVFKKIAKINRTSISEEFLDDIECRNEPTGRFSDLIKYKQVLLMVILLLYTNWTMVCTYYGISTDMTLGTSNIFLNTFFMGLVELPSGPIAGIMCQKLGRVKSYCIFAFISCVGLVTIPFLEDNESYIKWIKLTIALMTKCVLTVAWNACTVMRTEIVPVSIRNTSLFFIELVVPLGLAICPQIVLLDDYTAHYFSEIFFGFQLMVGFFVAWFFLPETKGLEMPDTAEEAQNLRRGNEKEWNRRKTSFVQHDEYECEPLKSDSDLPIS